MKYCRRGMKTGARITVRIGLGRGLISKVQAIRQFFFQLKAYLRAGGAYHLEGSDALVFECITIF
jgi:hypothetical protein